MLKIICIMSNEDFLRAIIAFTSQWNSDCDSNVSQWAPIHVYSTFLLVYTLKLAV